MSGRCKVCVGFIDASEALLRGLFLGSVYPFQEATTNTS